jgi:hypothetical protein
MHPVDEHRLLLTRRQLLGKSAVSIGGIALASLLRPDLLSGANAPSGAETGILGGTHFPAKAKRVIYLFQSGGPSQMDLFDHKPMLEKLRGQDLPASIRQGQRLTGMTSGQKSFPVAPSLFQFKQHGESRAWVSELMPHTAGVVDDLCFIKSMETNAINHDPGITFLQTGSEQPGRPSMGSWVSYGLGSANANLPSFVVLVSNGNYAAAQPIYARLWGSGFLPTKYQGVKFRSAGDPVLYLSNTEGVDSASRRQMLDGIGELNRIRHDVTGDPEIATRIAQYEMSFRMQSSVPDLMDVSSEPQHILDMYGPDVRKPGSFASNCLMARRLAERDVRFIQLYHTGWDQHSNLPKDIVGRCEETDQGAAALIRDLKMRGLLEDTLVIWGGEFGRTVYSQGALSADNYGRDHHPRCFTMWMAGGGVKPGLSYGETDDYCYNIAKDPVHVHDLQATILHLLGVDHEKLTYKTQGRRFRLTDVHGNVVKPILV